eukprot:scaffold18868_cov59-Phaeocystis_antarctica.AAC.3
MPLMSVTLDVSKLSGWLNFDAACRVERRACDAERGVWAGGGRAWAGGSASRAAHARGEGPTAMAAGAIGHARSAPRTCSPWL